MTKGVHYVAVENNYDGNRDVQITALKLKTPIVRQMLKTVGDEAQFEIHSAIYLAWQGDRPKDKPSSERGRCQSFQQAF
jgi:hypothetical protein